MSINLSDLVQPTMVVVLLVCGMGAALLGSIKIPLATRLRIDEGRVGGLVSLFGFTLIPVILTAGFMTDLLGRRIVMLSGGLMLAAGLLLLAAARSYRSALAAVILLSAGWALLVNIGNVLTPAAFPGHLAYATNLANVFFGVGAFLTPLLLAALIGRVGFSTTLGLVAILALVPAGLALGIDFAAIAPTAPLPGAATPESSRLLGDPFLWLCGLALLFYSPLEASVGAWATTYLGEQSFREKTAAAFLSAFWLAFMAARLVTAFTLPPGHERMLILALSVACAGVLIGMVLGRGRKLAAAMVVVAGAIFGPIFPTLLAILLGHFAAPLHGRAVGYLFAIGGIGWTGIPMLIGAYARRTSIRRGFSVAVLSAVGLSAVALALLSR